MQKKQAGMEILFNWWRFSNSDPICAICSRPLKYKHSEDYLLCAIKQVICCVIIYHLLSEIEATIFHLQKSLQNCVYLFDCLIEKYVDLLLHALELQLEELKYITQQFLK